MCMTLSMMATHTSKVSVTELQKTGTPGMGSISHEVRLPSPTYTSLYMLKSALVTETA